MKNHVGYLELLFEPERLIAEAEEALSPHVDEFDAFISTGLSGGPVVALLGYHFRKPFAIVRKGEFCHSYLSVETGLMDGRFLFVDDLLCSGATLARVCEAMRGCDMGDARLQGLWLYQNGPIMSNGYVPKERLYRHCNDDAGLTTDSLALVNESFRYWGLE